MIEELFINKWCYLTYRYILLDGSVMVRRYRVFVERIEQLRDERIVKIEYAGVNKWNI